MQKNDTTLVGRIGQTFKEGKSKQGRRYIAFAVEIETKTSFKNVIHVLCFREVVINYLKGLKVHEGTPVIVFGSLGSWRDEIKGSVIVQNAVFADKVYVIKT